MSDTIQLVFTFNKDWHWPLCSQPTHKSCVAEENEPKKWDFESVPAMEKDLFGNDKSMQGRMERTMNDNHILFNLILYMWNVNSDEPRKEPVRTFSHSIAGVWDEKAKKMRNEKSIRRSLNHFSRAILHSHFRITFRHFFPFFFASSKYLLSSIYFNIDSLLFVGN